MATNTSEVLRNLVQATNAVGDSQWSKPGIFTTKARVPSCVAAPTCEAVSEDTMRISWDVPSSNGSPVTLYQCFMNEGGDSELQLIYAGEHPSCERSGLKVCGLLSTVDCRTSCKCRHVYLRKTICHRLRLVSHACRVACSTRPVSLHQMR